MAKDFAKLQELLIKIFLFIPKLTAEKVIGNLTDDNYYLIMIGVWLVIIICTWFVLWITFKVIGWF